MAFPSRRQAFGSRKGGVVKKQARKQASSWRDLRKKRPPAGNTSVARRRRWELLFRTFLLLALFGLILSGILGIAYYARVTEKEPVVEESPEPLQLEFQTDGVLTRSWFQEAFPELLYRSARSLDVRDLRERLENIGQVAKARVMVRLPDLLRVQVEEREPLMRVRIRQDGGAEVWLLARDGNLYQGMHYPKDALRRLPGLAGLRIKRADDGFKRVRFLEEVAHILDLGKERVPSLARHWRVVDLSGWNPLQPMRSSLVRLQSRHIREIVFSTENPENQIERLAEILQHSQRYQLGLPTFIDLSFSNEVVIRYNE